ELTRIGRSCACSLADANNYRPLPPLPNHCFEPLGMVPPQFGIAVFIVNGSSASIPHLTCSEIEVMSQKNSLPLVESVAGIHRLLQRKLLYGTVTFRRNMSPFLPCQGSLRVVSSVTPSDCRKANCTVTPVTLVMFAVIR